jgi:hypothetical protein
VQFPHLKGLDGPKIHHELEAVLGPDAVPYSKVMRAFRSAIWNQSDAQTPHREIDDAIVQALGELPFASMRGLREGCDVRQLLYIVTSPSRFTL